MNKNVKRSIFLLLLPGVLFLTVFFGIPILWSLLSSLNDVSKGSGFHLSIQNYLNIFTKKIYRDGFFFSLYLSFVPIFVSLIISIPLASLLQKEFIGKKVFHILYKIPLVVPSIVSAFIILLLFDRGGWIQRVMNLTGGSFVPLVRDPFGIGVIMATVWKRVPFMTLIISGSMASINPEVLQAARTMGARPLTVFLRIQIPLALPGITAATLLTFIGSMGGYVIPQLIGPVYPIPLSVHMYELMTYGEWEQVFAIGSFLSFVSVAVLLIYYRITQKAHYAASQN